MKGILVGMPLVVETDRLWQQRVSKEPVKLHGKGAKNDGGKTGCGRMETRGKECDLSRGRTTICLSMGTNYGRYSSSVEFVSVVVVVYHVRTQ